eukprot:scaffold32414_cov35-Tisochrysis_lutea.AAC.3
MERAAPLSSLAVTAASVGAHGHAYVAEAPTRRRRRIQQSWEGVRAIHRVRRPREAACEWLSGRARTRYLLIASLRLSHVEERRRRAHSL